MTRQSTPLRSDSLWQSIRKTQDIPPPEKPECHMLYNVTTMASTWHTLATADVSLLRHQMDTICALQTF